jgi:hypothetical protein
MKKANRERLAFRYWWWGGGGLETTVEVRDRNVAERLRPDIPAPAD